MNADSAESQLIYSCNHDGSWWYFPLHSIKPLEMASLTFSHFIHLYPFLSTVLGSLFHGELFWQLMSFQYFHCPAVWEPAVSPVCGSESYNLYLYFEQICPVQKARAIHLSWIRPIKYSHQVGHPSWMIKMIMDIWIEIIGMLIFLKNLSLSTPFLRIPSGHIRKIGIVKAWIVILV